MNCSGTIQQLNQSIQVIGNTRKTMLAQTKEVLPKTQTILSANSLGVHPRNSYRRNLVLNQLWV